ncbi:MAG TPA: ChaN family lipoprotein [Kofleriaceae bacterium]|jgi:uncharacterized iron-regulated protein
MVVRAVWIAIAAAGAACGGTYGGVAPGPKAAAGARPRGVEAAALPYHVLDRTGHQLDEAAFWAKLATVRVACVGEEHTNPHHHWVQLQVVQHLVKAWPHIALGMEMFQRPFQGVLDDFAARKIDEDALRSRAGWNERWGYDFGNYRPTIAAVVAAHGALVALNAPKELTHKVAHHGLESLSPDERAQVPELDLKVAAHRAWFDALMEDLGGTDVHSKAAPPKDVDTKQPAEKSPDKPPDEAMPTADNIYTVQVIWDETMADTAAKFLAAHPDARMVILAGNGHCHDTAIVDRLKRRGIKDVVSIRPVIDDGQDAVAEVLAKPMHDFIVVLDLPPDVKAQMQSAR